MNFAPRNSPCPCGSGKKYKHCHEATDLAAQATTPQKKKLPHAVWSVPLSVVLGGLTVFFVMKEKPRGAAVISPARQANAGTEGPPGSPWQYDPSTNRHFDPGHNHWHSGQPPAGRVGTASTAGSLASSVRISPLANPGDATQIGSTGTAGPPGKPYEYDSVTNRHFDPGHNHWHPGLPPAGKVDTNTSIAVPNSSSATDGPPGKDWEYDPKTNRHFDPGHKHWHTGQPPNNVGTAAPGQVVPLVATSKSATGTKEDPLSLEQARRAIGLSPIVEASGGRGWKGPIGKPWEFNSNANLHYNPDHGHWHSGPPPIKPALGITTQ